MREVSFVVAVALAALVGVGGAFACSDDPPAPSWPDGGPTSGSNGRSGISEDPADDTPRVRYVGRVDESDPAGPRLGWSGSRVIVRFKGSALKVRIKERSFEDGPSHYDLSIDGELQEDAFVPDDGQGEYDLATDLSPDEPHVVELYRRTEAMVGITQILGFEYPDGGDLLAPSAWPKRRIEFLGDSESTGYGIDCDAPSERFSGATENERKAFPALVAKAVGAEEHNLAFSGKGVIRNEDSSSEVYDMIYPRALPLPPGASAWNFGSWAPDVVWINLGANDWGPGLDGDRSPPDADEFKRRYGALVRLVRQKNPNAHIVCAVQGFVNDDYPQGFEAYSNLKRILQEVVEERHAARDAKVYFHELPRARDGIDLTGCASHPNAEYHKKAAASVAAKVRAIAGW
jgi:lysophospholipase L1-like esterase